MTEKLYEKFQELCKTMSPEAAAKKCGCCTKTIKNYEENHPTATGHASIAS